MADNERERNPNAPGTPPGSRSDEARDPNREPGTGLGSRRESAPGQTRQDEADAPDDAAEGDDTDGDDSAPVA